MDKGGTCFSHDHKRKEKLELKSQFERSVSMVKPIRTLPETQDYLKERHIFDIFHFLLGHLVVHRPTDPIQYLYQLLDDCILFRSGFKGPRLFWMNRHVEAIYEQVSTGTTDLLPLNRYKTAMKILGISCYVCPVERVPGYVDRETFCAEALKNMEKELARITSIRRGSTDCDCDTCNV